MESIDQLRIMMIFYGSPCNKHLVIELIIITPINDIHQKIIEKCKTIFQRVLTFFNERTKKSNVQNIQVVGH